MGRPRRFALALVCATAAVAGCAASLGGFAWSGIETPATPIWNRGAAGSATVASADAGPLRALLAHAVASVAAVTTSHRELGEPAVASAAAPATDAATIDPGPRETFGLAGVSAAEAPVVEAASPDAGPTPPPETHERLVSLFRPEAPVEEAPQPAVRPIEIVDECLVVDVCIDEYLWALYERTPKVDTNKVTKQIKTTVKTKKGKTRTVTKTTTDYVVADFTWKDPAAAQKVGMSVKDYVIGGMDRGFKLKLFRASHDGRCRVHAGHNQRIPRRLSAIDRSRPQGGERQLISRREPPRRLWPRACHRSRERQGGDPSAAIRRKRSAVEVGRCARDRAWGRPAISRSRPSTCGGDRWQGICGQARPVACAQGCKERRRERRKIDGQHAAACARTQENQARDPDGLESGGDRRAFELTIVRPRRRGHAVRRGAADAQSTQWPRTIAG